MIDVQRLADCLGGESLNVKPQAYGGRKILTLIIYKGLEIVCTTDVMSVDNIGHGVASVINKKLIYNCII